MGRNSNVRGCLKRKHSPPVTDRDLFALRLRADCRPGQRLPGGRSGCWEWDGATTGHGYGIVRHDGQAQLAHRAAYELWVGPIPENTAVCHHCDNPLCCRPDHLFLGTKADNNRDAMQKGGARGPWKNRPFTREELLVILNADPKLSVAALARSLGREDGSGYQAVWHIRHGRLSHVHRVLLGLV